MGKHVFEECIKKALRGKTIVLVTHQLQVTGTSGTHEVTQWLWLLVLKEFPLLPKPTVPRWTGLGKETLMVPGYSGLHEALPAPPWARPPHGPTSGLSMAKTFPPGATGPLPV